jgi:hypothetical protein
VSDREEWGKLCDASFQQAADDKVLLDYLPDPLAWSTREMSQAHNVSVQTLMVYALMVLTDELREADRADTRALNHARAQRMTKLMRFPLDREVDLDFSKEALAVETGEFR